MIIDKPSEIESPALFFCLRNYLKENNIYIKLEGLNMAGSVKAKTAKFMIEALEKENVIKSDTALIESSSGNLGIALSILCKEKGIRFVCVTDPNILPYSEKLISLYAAEMIKVTEKDKNGGYLGTRINLIKKICGENPKFIWLNQYANKHNINAHYQTTGKEIRDQFKDIDYVFIGVGTAGTITGCAKLLKEHYKNIKIIAVDAEGSVTFGGKSKKRLIPGIGTSRPPEILEKSLLDDLVMVSEEATIKCCNTLLRDYGLFLGGSSGSAVAAILQYQHKIPKNSTVVTISPDFGFKYSDTVYNFEWIHQYYGLDSLS